MNYKRTLVLTSAFGYKERPQSMNWMLNTAKLHGIEVMIIGEGQPFTTLLEAKVTQVRKVVKELAGFDYVMMIDAVDTLFATGLGEIHSRWEEYKSDFVMGGEINNYPWPRKCQNHPTKAHRFGSLNSGFYLATWDGFWRVMDYVANQPYDGYAESNTRSNENDQAAFWQAYMAGMKLTIDYKCLLSQAAFGLNRRWVGNPDIIWGRRPYNMLTHSYPCTIHFNGHSKGKLGEAYEVFMI